jgi:hypothetical protein
MIISTPTPTNTYYYGFLFNIIVFVLVTILCVTRIEGFLWKTTTATPTFFCTSFGNKRTLFLSDTETTSDVNGNKNTYDNDDDDDDDDLTSNTKIRDQHGYLWKSNEQLQSQYMQRDGFLIWTKPNNVDDSGGEEMKAITSTSDPTNTSKEVTLVLKSGKYSLRAINVVEQQKHPLSKVDTTTNNSNGLTFTTSIHNHDENNNSTMITSDFGTLLLPRNNGSWILDDERWFKYYQCLKEYYYQNYNQYNSSCNTTTTTTTTSNVPIGYICPNTNLSLGIWVARQRQEKRRGQLSKERQQILDQLDFFEWDVHKSWMEQYYALERFQQQYGHCHVPIKYSTNRTRTEEGEVTSSLGMWVQAQRQDKKRGRLSKDREVLLNQLNFPWYLKNMKPWIVQYHALENFRRQNGHCRVPRNYNVDPSLGKWVENQRRRRGRMSQERQRLLNNLGFQWDIRKPWMEHYQTLQTFQKETGHCNVPEKDDPSFSRWAKRQRSQKKTGSLTHQQEQLLNEIGFEW